MAYELKNVAILNVKGNEMMTRNDAINRLNNYKFDDKGTL